MRRSRYKGRPNIEEVQKRGVYAQMDCQYRGNMRCVGNIKSREDYTLAALPAVKRDKVYIKIQSHLQSLPNLTIFNVYPSSCLRIPNIQTKK